MPSAPSPSAGRDQTRDQGRFQAFSDVFKVSVENPPPVETSEDSDWQPAAVRLAQSQVQAPSQAQAASPAAVPTPATVQATELALAWCYTRNFVTSTIIGATTLAQLKTRLKANQFFIATVLPLSGRLAPFANEVLEGIQHLRFGGNQIGA